MTRSRTAFIVAPLWVPLATVIFAKFELFPHPGQLFWVVFSGLIAATFAYAGTLILGAPAFRFLVSRNWTAVWIAPTLGMGVAAIMWALFLVLFPLSLGEGFEGIGAGLSSAIKHPVAQAIGLLVTGGLGALVGLTLWLIARPDRTDI